MLRIDAATAHRINGDLTLASQYFDKIFTRLNGPPRWLARNIDLAFEWIDTPTFSYRRYNPYWNKQEVPPTVTRRSKCTHRQYTRSDLVCTCACCHYRCPTHSSDYYL